MVARTSANSARSLSEARLMQDLRTTAELVARDLRRAGHWSAAASGVRVDGDVAAPLANPHAPISTGAAPHRARSR